MATSIRMPLPELIASGLNSREILMPGMAKWVAEGGWGGNTIADYWCSCKDLGGE